MDVDLCEKCFMGKHFFPRCLLKKKSWGGGGGWRSKVTVLYVGIYHDMCMVM